MAERKTNRQKAIAFLGPMRGQYIVGQAFYLAIKRIEARPEIEREPSNAADMQFLMEELFPMYASVEAAKEEIRAYETAERLGQHKP